MTEDIKMQIDEKYATLRMIYSGVKWLEGTSCILFEDREGYNDGCHNKGLVDVCNNTLFEASHHIVYIKDMVEKESDIVRNNAEGLILLLEGGEVSDSTIDEKLTLYDINNHKALIEIVNVFEISLYGNKLCISGKETTTDINGSLEVYDLTTESLLILKGLIHSEIIVKKGEIHKLIKFDTGVLEIDAKGNFIYTDL